MPMSVVRTFDLLSMAAKVVFDAAADQVYIYSGFLNRVLCQAIFWGTINCTDVSWHWSYYGHKKTFQQQVLGVQTATEKYAHNEPRDNYTWLILLVIAFLVLGGF